MMIAHDRPTLEEANANAPVPPTEREIGELAQIAVSSDLAEALAFIANIRSDGTSLDVILLRLIAPAARRLGDDWLSDLRTFTEVTVGLGTLHEVVHALGPSLAEGIGKGIASRGSVVLVAAPSEQHTLGVYMLGEFFRRAGWAVQVDPTMSQDELVALVQAERVELVGITVSNTLLLQPLARFVAAVRLASKNPQTAFMVGGCLEAARDAKEIGAQFFSDPRDAVLWLERHVRHARAARQS
jgi:methanogenic corrinoid protein MtbC1